MLLRGSRTFMPRRKSSVVKFDVVARNVMTGVVRVLLAGKS